MHANVQNTSTRNVGPLYAVLTRTIRYNAEWNGRTDKKVREYEVFEILGPDIPKVEDLTWTEQLIQKSLLSTTR